MSRAHVRTKPADGGLAGRVRAWIERLGPYQSLLLLALPVCLVEPMKLAAVAIAGEGHWITGTGMIIAAYAISLLLVERLFLIAKPKLMKLRWLASIWARVVVLRASLMRSIGWRARRPKEQSRERLL
jgi:hypothetical protein